MSVKLLQRLGTSPTGALQTLWERVRDLPGGKRLFSRLIGQMAPYTGTIRAEVVEAGPGYAKLRMKDRRAVRNHLDSVHAVALANLAEETTGIAMSLGLPPDARGILTGLSVDYVKKARGVLTAECEVEPPEDNARREVPVEGVIRDEVGDIVARATARWLVGPQR
ncbi:MAG: hotdog fold domain-containing protein [Myxococcota bacterium]